MTPAMAVGYLWTYIRRRLLPRALAVAMSSTETTAASPVSPLPFLSSFTELSLVEELQGMEVFGPIPIHDSRLTLDTDVDTFARAVCVRPFYGDTAAVHRLVPLPKSGPNAFVASTGADWALLIGGEGFGAAMFRLILMYNSSNRLYVAVSGYTMACGATFRGNEAIPVCWAAAKCFAVIRCWVLSLPCKLQDGSSCIFTARNYAATWGGSLFSVVRLPEGVFVCPSGHWDRYFFPGALDMEYSLLLLVKEGYALSVYSIAAGADAEWEILARRVSMVDGGGLCKSEFSPVRPQGQQLPVRFCSFDVAPRGIVIFEDARLGNRRVLFHRSLLEDRSSSCRGRG